MTGDFEEKEPAFKVVDRRRFTEDGEEKVAAAVPKEEPKKTQMEDFAKKEARPPISFALFIQSLAHQTMMALGIIPWPDSGLVRKELTLAKETIDILQMLKDKTSGNLSKDEEGLLTELLYQLKVAFVEIAKAPVEEKSPLIK